MYKIQQISLPDLIVNTENYRFESLASQKEAIDRMIENQGIKIYNLAKHIIENGLNPNKIIQVSPSNSDKKKFIVLEGNRRVIALKLLYHPDLIDESVEPGLKTKFKLLRETNKDKLTTKINCVVYDTPTEAEKWIKIEHTGENEGIGVVSWNKLQSDRFNEKVEGKSSAALKVVDLLQKSPQVSQDIRRQLHNLKLSNLSRLLDDPDVRHFLGIEIDNDILHSTIPKEEVIKGLSQVVEDLLEPSFTVKEIYRKEDREDYINRFKSSSKPNLKLKANKPWKIDQISAVLSAKSSGSFPAYRRKLIAKSCVLSINNGKINRIYRELQALDVPKFTNSAAVLLRVFVELSCDSYLEKHRLKPKLNPGELLKLKKKILLVVDDLVAKGLIENPDCKGVRTAIQNKDSLLGVDTLHAYVHNKHFSPAHRELIITWDNIEVFMQKVWENIK